MECLLRLCSLLQECTVLTLVDVLSTGSSGGLSKPNQLRMEDITIPQGTFYW